jgi:TolA-binding protein
MPQASSDSKTAAALESLVELGRELVSEPDRADLDAGLSVVRARLDAARARRKLVGRFSVVAALVVLPLAWSFAERVSWQESAALTYEIEGGSVLDGGYLRESGHEGMTLSFNEGTRFVFTPGTRGRLRSVDSEGARVGIENGSASFEVVPASGRHWEVEVGPFVVTVKGTAFTVSWDPEHEQFELLLRRGRVVVSGPVSGGDLTLSGGQRLVVSLPKAQTLITQAASDAAIDDAVGDPEAPTPSVAEVVVAEADAGTAVSPGTTGSRPSEATNTSPVRSGKKKTARRWSEELAHGRWDQILADVQRAGVATVLETATSDELYAVANAARYRLRTQLARRALLAQRRRFPQSRRALEAAFLLGRVEEARGNTGTGAITWYDEYLTHAPRGAYAAEALGRKMTIVRTVSGPMRAKPIAKDYLRRFPQGSYASSARALLDER